MYLYIVSRVVILSNWVCDNWVYRFPKIAGVLGDISAVSISQETMCKEASKDWIAEEFETSFAETFVHQLPNNSNTQDSPVRKHTDHRFRNHGGGGLPNLAIILCLCEFPGSLVFAGALLGERETHKHKQICGIVPGLNGWRNLVYVFWGRESIRGFEKGLVGGGWRLAAPKIQHKMFPGIVFSYS